MSSPPTYVKLAQLENQLILGKVSGEEYFNVKWELLCELHEKQEVLAPIFKGKRKREIRDQNKKKFCYVPPGPFIFGPDAEYGEIKAGIYISKYPVTIEEFMIFVEYTDHEIPDEGIKIMREVSPENKCPVSYISWLDAKEYCRWLRQTTGAYYSLPSEAEWEYAARGIDGRFYPWGYDAPNHDIACFSSEEMYFDNTVPVTSYPKNKSPFGCIDMVGNLWEWCLDDFDDPSEPHVMRGGSYLHYAESVNCVSKIYSSPPDKHSDYTGFRIIYLPNEMFDEYKNALDGD